MLKEYFDVNVKKIGYFLGLLIGTVTIVTQAYGGGLEVSPLTDGYLFCYKVYYYA